MVHNFEFILDFFLIHTVSKLNKFKMVGFKVVALVRKFWMSCIGLLYQFMCNYSHSPVGTPSCCCYFWGFFVVVFVVVVFKVPFLTFLSPSPCLSVYNN